MTHALSGAALGRDGSTVGDEKAHAATPVFVQRLSSNDASELASRIPGWEVELTQLRPGRFDGHLIAISLGSVMICTGKFDQPLLQHVSGPRGCMIVNRPGRGSVPLRYLGSEVQDDECFVGGPASEGEAISGAGHVASALSVRLDAWEGAAHWLKESQFLALRGTMLRRTGRSWANDFLDAMSWIVEAVAQYPEAISQPEVRGSLADLLLARVNVLGAGDFPIKQDRKTRIHRRAAVERAREYIRRNLSEPIRLSQLCQYARTEARALEYGFRDVVGLSPMAYVRMTRLHRARRLLRSALVLRSSISEIALDCGFWHLSQFSMDYKTLFGESPSSTVRRTQTELPAIARFP